MPFEFFKGKKFSKKRLVIIGRANQIIDEYVQQEFTLTLRQLYYQFVARDLIPNNAPEYKRLGDITNDARLAGEIDWDAIEDRTRNLKSNTHWEDPEEIVRACAHWFLLDKWAVQPTRVEVWIEKEALIGVIEPICRELDVPYFACRGYNSQSEQYKAGKRFEDYLLKGQDVLVLHFGDHDPSGLDMTRDNRDRLEFFSKCDIVENDAELTIKRLALNIDQVETYKLPPNAAKFKDTRAKKYISKYGKNSWELDALEPGIISDLVKANVLAVRDEEIWSESCKIEKKHKETLFEAAVNLG